MNSTALSILLLWDNAGKRASTVAAHVGALMRGSRHSIHPFSMMGDIPQSLDLDRFDVIVVHYSLVACMDAYMSQQARARLAASRALKAIFIQDEYRFIDRSITAMKEVGVKVLFTCVPKEEIHKVYSEEALPDVKKVNVLTGYVDEQLLDYPVPRYSSRPTDISYRARKVPAWLGELGQEKWIIGKRVGQDASRYGLVVDLAYREEERLYGDAWLRFVSNSKATLGVESGSSVFDFTGKIQETVEAVQLANPSMEFAEMQKRYFGGLEGKIRLNQISPRCFEAAALRTLMILYEGEYSGRLVPWRHYLPLKKDHSNFPQLVSILRDETQAQEIITSAFEEVALHPANSFKAMAEIFDDAIESEIGGSYVPVSAPYKKQELITRQEAYSKTNNRGLLSRAIFAEAYFILFKNILGFTSEAFRDNVQRYLNSWLRPIFRKFFRR